MIARQKSQTFGRLFSLSQRERAGVRENHTFTKPLIKNHNVVQSFSPGLRGTSYPGYIHTKDSTLKELNHSPFLILGDSIVAGPKLTSPHPNQPLIKVDNSLSPTNHKPIIRPENKGIKPKSNHHKPKKFTTSHSYGDIPQGGPPARACLKGFASNLR